MTAFRHRKRAVFTCEFCNSLLIKRTSYLSHQHLRHDTWVCDNPVCGASYTGHTELTGIASPTGMPNARPSDLPESPTHARLAALKAYRTAQAENQLDLLDSLPANPDH